MRPKAVGVALAGVVALAAVAGATAQNEPQAIADASLGTLHVTTAVYVSRTAVTMQGVWTDRGVSTTEPVKKLKALADLSWVKPVAC